MEQCKTCGRIEGLCFQDVGKCVMGSKWVVRTCENCAEPASDIEFCRHRGQCTNQNLWRPIWSKINKSTNHCEGIEGNTEFVNKIVDERISYIKKILTQKAKEYAHNGDRFHNFKVAASILGTTKEKALIGMFVKHMVSVLDLVNGSLEITTGMINEKIGDTINYMILLEAMLKEGLTS